MSTTGDGPTSSNQTSSDSDSTQRIQRQRPGTQTGQGSALRDGAMARTTPRRDLERRARAAGAVGLEERPSRPAAGRPGAGEGRPRAGSTAAGAAAASSGGRRPAPRAGAPTRGRPAGGRRGPRRVRLTLQKIDPLSVMKISFLVSVALGIALVVAVVLLWTLLSNMQVFTQLDDFVAQITAGEDDSDAFELMAFLGFGRVVSASVVLGVINVFLLTALATLTAFLYNICAALVGGARLTLSDE